VKREPGEAAHRRGLASAHRQLGTLSLTERNAAEGKKHLTESLRVARELRELDVDDPDGLRELARALERLGDVCLDLKEYAQAEGCYLEAVKCRQELFKKDPLHDGDEWMRAVGSARLGQILGDLGDLPAAREHFKTGIAQLRKFLEVHPRRLGAQEDLGGAQERLGVLCRRVGDLDEARKLFLQILDRRQKLAGPEPASFAPGYNLTLCHANLWLIELDCLDFPAAEKWANEALRVLRDLEKRGLVKSPKLFQNWVARHQNIIALCRVAPQVVDNLELALKAPKEQALDLLWYRARLLLKQEKYADAAATAEEIRKLEGKDPRTLANVAMIHAACVAAKDPEFREQSQRQALAALAAAVDQGYHDLARVSSHPDYDALRADPDFQKIVTKFRTKLLGKEGQKQSG
jgi:tetratricopeptide (TPR) repeat protein